MSMPHIVSLLAAPLMTAARFERPITA